MARIPQTVSRVSGRISGGGSSGRISTPFARADADAFGAAPARALQGLGQSVTQLGAVMAKSEQAEKTKGLESAKTQATVDLEKLRAELDQDQDYQTHTQRYADGVVKIKEAAQKTITDPKYYALFEEDMALPFTKGEVSTQRDVITKQKVATTAQLNDSLDNYAKLAAETADPLERKIYSNQARVAVDRMASAGLLNPLEAQAKRDEFQKNMDTAIIQNSIRVDPQAAFADLGDPKNYPGLNASELEIWRRRALEAGAAQTARDNAEADRRVRLADRAEKKLHEATAQQAEELRYKGELTPEWLHTHMRDMDPADYRLHMKQLRGGGDWNSDPVEYDRLWDLAKSKDPDVIRQIKHAYESGNLLTQADRDTLMRLYDSTAKGLPDLPSVAGEDYIKTSLRVNELNPSPGATTRLANATREWQTFIRNNPDIAQGKDPEAYEKANKEADRIVKSYQLVEADQLTVTMPTPQFMTGGRTDMDLAATYKKTVDAHSKGQISSAEFDRQCILIQRWQEMMQRKAAAGQVR